MRGQICVSFVVACSAILVFPAIGSAQSAVSGQVSDSSGGVLPGVTVTAASPALIEKQRVATTDEQGRYTIVDLRPGAYDVMFSLSGFRTLRRDGMVLPSNFTMTVNAVLEVGALEETLVVTGQSPLIDVQSAQTSVAVSRDFLEALPTSRTWQAAAALMPGVKASQQSVGGARTAVQPRMTVHGTGPQETTVDTDGMKMNTSQAGGSGNHNLNDLLASEVTVQTGAPGAEVSGGGLHINFIPRDGGNTFSGSSYFAYSGSGWQSDNLSEELRSRGITQPTATDFLYDVSQWLSGPVIRDRLWFFGSFRSLGNDEVVVDSFYPDGRPGEAENRLHNVTGRLTWQISPRNKVGAYYDRAFKTVGHEFASGEEILKASRRRTPDQVLYQAAAKWTSTLSSKMLLENGLGIVLQNFHMLYQEGIAQPRNSDAWYANASRFDFITTERTTAGVAENRTYLPRYSLSSKLSYVTGSHALATGVQWHFATTRIERDANADLTQRYRNGVPEQVDVYNTPVGNAQRANADLGIYAQDAWTIKRLTLHPGIRLEYLNGSIEAVSLPAGRFTPAREFPRVPNLPNWFTVAPRFSAVYALTNDSRTSLRGGVNKYYLGEFTTFASRYDPLRFQTDTRDWRDLNRDDIAQDHEIGVSNTNNFGSAPNRRPDPSLNRQYFVTYNLSIDRELLPGLSVGAAWYRNNYYDVEKQDNVLVDVSDYSSFQTANPLTGEPITVYNLNRAKQGQVSIVDTTSAGPDRNRRVYDSVELTFTARLSKGEIFGGWSNERDVSVTCDVDNPNTLTYCDQRLWTQPFRGQFHFAGSYQLPLGVTAGASILSYAGNPLTVNWSVPAGVFPGGRTEAVTIPLNPPGSSFLKQWNQVDVTAKKSVRIGQQRIDASVDVYNLLNSSVVLAENQTFGSNLGRPTVILQGRMVKVSAALKF